MYDISFSQIRAFERTVRLGGVHAAAEDLGLTQPAISQRIRELERILGTKVFVRCGRSLRLSADGAAFLVYADQFLRTAEEMRVRLTSGNPLDGILRLGVSASFARVCLEPLLKRLNAKFGDLKTSIYVGDSNSISELLNDQKLDLAVTSEHKIASYIHRQKLGVNRHGWFVCLPYKIDLVVTQEEISAHHLIITPPPSRHNATVLNWFGQANIVPQWLSTCDNLSTTIHMVLSGIGIACLPTRVMQEYVVAGAVRELAGLPPVSGYEVWVCYQDEKLRSGLRQVVEMIKTIITEYQLYV